MKLRVLFLCATNGVQSPMAEALLGAVDSEHFDVVSAGIDAVGTHPLTVEVMKEVGVDLRGRAAKAVREVRTFPFDMVITLCNRARAACPRLPDAEIIHWQFPDPMATSDHVQQERMFRIVRDQIAQRVRLFALVQARSA